MTKPPLFNKFYFPDLIFAILLLSIVIHFTYRYYIFSATFNDVAKVYKIDVRRHSVHYIEYEYFVNKKRYTGDKKINSRDDKKYFKRCFLVEISKKNLAESKINLKKEIFNHIKKH